MRTVVGTSLALALGTLAGPAGAQMTVYYHVGSWDAFSGPTGDGKMVCGVDSTNPGDNRSFSLRLTIGGDSVMFEAKKPTWNIPAGLQIPVVVQVGLDSPWNFQGLGNGQAVDWSVDRNALPIFDAQFRLATSMTVSFPSGDEPPWTVGLSGSTAISNAFARCVRDMTQRTEGQQPAPRATGPTQPFSLTPTQEPGQPAK